MGALGRWLCMCKTTSRKATFAAGVTKGLTWRKPVCNFDAPSDYWQFIEISKRPLV